jgi:branched-chain amino acid transport system ATP-binding protein
MAVVGHAVRRRAADGGHRPRIDGPPRTLLLDEPSVGIAPRLKRMIFDSIQRITSDGTAVLLVEQDATSALRIADRVYVLEHGRTVREGRPQELAGEEYIRQVYLGV